MIIKNKNLKHMTIGDYLKSKTVEMPANLSEQITMNFCLETLNLFSNSFLMLRHQIFAL